MKNGIVQKIDKLRRERNAVILAHIYQIGEVQDIADYVGDSLGLSQKAAATEAEVIVFCGVKFMAETAAIICPDKRVLLPDSDAGCPLADMITVDKLQEMKRKYPTAKVVCYVNSPAEVKAESDICCTSSNAVKVVESIEADQIIFVPDRCLGAYVATQTNKEIILWNGFCPTHHRVMARDIKRLKEEHPEAKVAVHPECTAEVIALADFVGSTATIRRYARDNHAKEFIIGTELGILHALRNDNPDKIFYSPSELVICPDMKLINLEKVLWALEDDQYHVTVPEDIRVRAYNAIERMLRI